MGTHVCAISMYVTYLYINVPHIYLIDEVLTPDSSRLRRRKSLLEPAKTENFDKQIIRDALTAVGKDGAGNFPQKI